MLTPLRLILDDLAKHLGNRELSGLYAYMQLIEKTKQNKTGALEMTNHAKIIRRRCCKQILHSKDTREICKDGNTHIKAR